MRDGWDLNPRGLRWKRSAIDHSATVSIEKIDIGWVGYQRLNSIHQVIRKPLTLFLLFRKTYRMRFLSTPLCLRCRPVVTPAPGIFRYFSYGTCQVVILTRLGGLLAFVTTYLPHPVLTTPVVNCGSTFPTSASCSRTRNRTWVSRM